MLKKFNENWIKWKIEKARAHMIKQANRYPLSSNKVVEASKRLDELLNKLERL